jgi:hypothetical protein
MMKDRGFVKIELDKTRYFKFDFRAARIFEDEFDKSLMDISSGKAKVGDISRLFYVALSHENIEGWSLEMAENMLSELIYDEKTDFEEVSQKIGEALTMYFGKSKKTDKRKN